MSNIPFTQLGPLAALEDLEVQGLGNPVYAPSPNINDVLTWNGTEWVNAPGGGGGAVASVFGRTGAVVAASGDYAAFYAPQASPTITGTATFATITGSGSSTFIAMPANSGFTVPAGAGNYLTLSDDGQGTSGDSIVLGSFTGVAGTSGGIELEGWNGSAIDIDNLIVNTSAQGVIVSSSGPVLVNGSNLTINTTGAVNVPTGGSYQVNGASIFANTALTGNPTAPTQAAGNNSTRIATTAFVNTIFAAPPAIGGTTPAAITGTTLRANTSFNFNGTAGVTQTAEAVGTLATMGGIVTTFTAVSDQRLKENIQPFERGLKDIEVLKTSSYEWNEKGREKTKAAVGQKFYGFVAQDLKKAIPEAVGEEDGYLTIKSHLAITAALVNAVTELSKRVKELEQEK